MAKVIDALLTLWIGHRIIFHPAMLQSMQGSQGLGFGGQGGMMTQTPISEHYHISCTTKDGSDRELTIYKEGVAWSVQDDWYDILPKSMDRELANFPTLDKAIRYTIRKLRDTFPDCQFHQGVGFPPRWEKVIKEGENGST